MTVQDLITDALTELGIIPAGDVPSAEDSDLALTRFNRILDDWDAESAGVYGVTQTEYTLTPNLSPHTIGPTGTFGTSSTPRPVAILGATVILVSSTPNVSVELAIRDQVWWLKNSVKELTSTEPTDLYYDPAFPNGNLYFWPVPTVANMVSLMVKRQLIALDLTDDFTFPPGYASALMLTLAESLAPAFKVSLDPQTARSAARARTRIFNNNDVIPRLETDVPSAPSSGTRPSWNYLIGS